MGYRITKRKKRRRAMFRPALEQLETRACLAGELVQIPSVIPETLPGHTIATHQGTYIANLSVPGELADKVDATVMQAFHILEHGPMSPPDMFGVYPILLPFHSDNAGRLQVKISLDATLALQAEADLSAAGLHFRTSINILNHSATVTGWLNREELSRVAELASVQRISLPFLAMRDPPTPLPHDPCPGAMPDMIAYLPRPTVPDGGPIATVLPMPSGELPIEHTVNNDSAPARPTSAEVQAAVADIFSDPLWMAGLWFLNQQASAQEDATEEVAIDALLV